MSQKAFSEYISAALSKKGLYAYKVALEVGLNPAVLTKVASGKRPPSEAILEKLSGSVSLGLNLTKLRAMKAASQYSREELKEAVKFSHESSPTKKTKI